MTVESNSEMESSWLRALNNAALLSAVLGVFGAVILFALSALEDLELPEKVVQ